MTLKVENEKWFRCPRCGRRWRGPVLAESIPCICYQDCDYCGKEQTVTTLVTKSEMTVKDYPGFESTLDPHPWQAAFRCTNCGYYSAKPPVDAYPEDETKFDEA